jgi:c-di-GMP-binding flagellar brake protein YcgR
MRPRRILTGREANEILHAAVAEQALAVLSVHDGASWLTFKSRFLERDPQRRFFVLDYRETHGAAPPPLDSGQYIGVSFRHKSRKVMFSTVVEAKGRYLLSGGQSVAAVRYRWPQTMTELQRRAYHRTLIPEGAVLPAAIWSGGAAARTQAHGSLSGECADLSCGGTLIRLREDRAPAWIENATIGVELQLPDGRPPILVDAYYRGCRMDSAGTVCAAVQFVGLEVNPDGRAILHRLARCVQRFHRQTSAADVLRGSGRFDADRSDFDPGSDDE